MKRRTPKVDPAEKDRVRDQATTAVMKKAGFSLKPKGDQMLAGFFTVLAIQTFIDTVMQVMINIGWRPPKGKRKIK